MIKFFMWLKRIVSYILYTLVGTYKICCFLGFDVGDLSESGPEDIEGMDASAAHIANLLSAEPADSMFRRNQIWFFVSIRI